MKHTITVVFSSRPDFGGGFQYSHCIWEAIKSLDRRVWGIEVICLSEDWAAIVRNDGFVPQLLLDGVPGKTAWRICKRIPGGIRAWRRFGHYFSGVLNALHVRRPDLAIFPCENYRSLGTIRPTLTPIHDLMYIYERRFPEVGAPAKFRQRALIDRNVCRFARGILVDSIKGREQLIESYHVASPRVHVLPYIAPPQIAALSVQVPTLPFDRFIFYPAQLWEHKNHTNLLRAVALLRDRGLRIDLILCGSEKNGATRVFAEINRLELAEQVAYLGYVSSEAMAHLYDRAVALVMPTYFGPTNIPPLEAFTRGCPVAVSNVYGMAEQVGDAALLFDPGDVVQIAEVVQSIWLDESLRSRLIAAGRAWVSKWNQATFNERFRAIVNECIPE